MPLLNTPSARPAASADSLPDTVFDPATCERRGFAKVEGDLAPHNLYYEIHGSGPEHVVLVMGMKNCSFSWQRQVEHFGRDARYSVLVLDNAGSGNSDTPRGPYTTGGMAREVFELLDLIGWTEERGVHVVGVSMGGMIALKMAALVPSRIASLLLGVTSAGHGIRRKLPPLDGLEITARTLFDDELERYMLMLYPQEWLDEVDEDDEREPKRTNRETRVAEYKQRMKLTPTQSLGQFFQLVAATTHHVPSADLEKINDEVPKVVILSGAHDHLIPTDSSTNLKKHMPDAELVVWEDSGHAIHSQRPQRFNELCERVWAEGRERSGSPRCFRMDWRLIYRKGRDGRQPTPIPAQYYPKGLQELVDRMWSSSSSKDKPVLHLTPVAADAVQPSPAELSDADLPWSEESGDGDDPPRQSTVTFAEREDDGLPAEDEPQHHGFKHLVERLMKPSTDPRELASPSRDEPNKPLQRLHNIVDQVLRRPRDDGEGDGTVNVNDPARLPLPPSQPSTPHGSPRQRPADLSPLADASNKDDSAPPPSGPTETTPVLKLPFAWPRARSRSTSRDGRPREGRAPPLLFKLPQLPGRSPSGAAPSQTLSPTSP